MIRAKGFGTSRRSKQACCFFLLLLLCLPGRPLFSTTPDRPATVILISIDGFRADFLENTSCPNLRRLADEGTRASWLIPIFPTKTFPNHYSIVTGLYAEEHGVVGNTMYDPEFDALFTMRKRDEVTNPRWWGGEPIWVTAERQGVTTASFFWPGSEAPIKGIQPSYWKRFDASIPEEQRVDQVLAWMEYPAERRPRFITLYFEKLDIAAHAYGPDYASVDTAVRIIDKAIGRLMNGLKERGLQESTSLVIVSDHGMAPVEKSRTIYLDDYLKDSDSVRVVDLGIVVSLWPQPGTESGVYQAIRDAHQHMKVFLKDSIPERLHYRNNRRIAPILLLADEGWIITVRGDQNYWRSRDRGGNHGYDNTAASMRGLFIAYGHSIAAGRRVDAFENIHIYNFLCRLLGINPAKNSGDPQVVRALLQPR